VGRRGGSPALGSATDGSDIPDSRRDRVFERLRLFVDAYRLSPADRNRFLDAVRENHRWSYRTIQAGAEAGEAGYQEYWSTTRSRAERAYTWYGENAEAIHDALLDQRAVARATPRRHTPPYPAASAGFPDVVRSGRARGVDPAAIPAG
jgi:hypothetical protein